MPVPGPLDLRYGVIAAGPNPPDQLSRLDNAWFIDYSSKPVPGVAPGKQVIYISSVDPVPSAQIARAAADFPAGSVWYVVGEPNAHGIDAADIVVGLHDTYELIRSYDPTALITSPSLLNFKYTCDNTCGVGYESGESWIENFRSSYMFIYGVEPPVDIWAIDTFPIVWDTARFPTVRSDIVTAQISQLRDYLNAVPALANKPIWVTEFGLHWGFTDWTFISENCGYAYPAGVYQTESVKQYLREVYQWLESNSSSKNIEAWFTFSTYRDLTGCHADGGYGLSLFEDDGSGLVLTDIGQFYWDWTHGIR